jgi:hypothetical protein
MVTDLAQEPKCPDCRKVIGVTLDGWETEVQSRTLSGGRAAGRALLVACPVCGYVLGVLPTSAARLAPKTSPPTRAL